MIIFLLLFCILAYLLRKRNSCVDLPKTQDSPAKCAILLTMHANTTEKIEMYKTVLNYWLDFTEFDIFTVDSAASDDFKISNHDRWKPFSFKQDGSYEVSRVSEYEIDSLEKAANYFQWENYDIIFKTTGKYFVPLLENTVKFVPSDAQCVFQSIHTYKSQNSELLGIRPEDFSALVSTFRDQWFKRNLEETLLFYALHKTCHRLPSLEVSPFTRYHRSYGDLLTSL